MPGSHAPRALTMLATATALLAATLTGCQSEDPPSQPAALPPATVPTSEPPTPLPAPPPPPCAVRTPAGRSIPMTVEQARAFTDTLARAERRDLSAAATDAAVVQAVPALAGSRRGIIRALTRPASLACWTDRSERPQKAEALTRSGLTRSAAALRQAYEDAFGYSPMGGFAGGGVSTGHTDGSAHYDGRAIDVFLTPRGAASTAKGWLRAHWLVAHASDLKLLSVIWQDHIWTDWASYAGWRDYVHPSGNTTNPTLRHLDHIHMAVVGPRRDRGTPSPSPASGRATS